VTARTPQTRDATATDAVLVVDKPQGMTSHDVVARVRRDLGTRAVGHAGTLDPLATGVLVVLVGQATKLAPYLSAANKTYRTTIALGIATDSLDADGEVTERVPPPANVFSSLDAAITAELARTEQVPPLVSAVHVDGVRAHQIARKKGAQALSLPPRPVRANSIRLIAVDEAGLGVDIELDVDKGYYVRAFARDLAARLGTVGHVARLRRLASGAFTLAEATALSKDAYSPLSIADAARRALPVATLMEDGVTRARHGKTLDAAAFTIAPASNAPHAWMSPSGALVAIGVTEGDASRVLRGFF
jgi:tRNA pseudouridine55 synthase